MVEQRLPEEWPAGVRPPWAEDFAASATAWLFDLVPPDYRLHGVLRGHPVALSRLALRHVAACLEAAREGYRTARTELRGRLPPPALDQVLAAYRTEGRRLAEALRAVELVDRALWDRSVGPVAE